MQPEFARTLLESAGEQADDRRNIVLADLPELDLGAPEFMRTDRDSSAVE
jgi:hypothetical protein